MKYLIALMLLTFSLFARADFFLGIELGSYSEELNDKLENQGIRFYTNIKNFNDPLFLTTNQYSEHADKKSLWNSGYIDCIPAAKDVLDNPEKEKLFFRDTLNVVSLGFIKGDQNWPFIKGTTVYFNKTYDEITKSKVFNQCNEILTEDDLNKLFNFYPRDNIEFKDYFDRFEKELKNISNKDKKIRIFYEKNTNNLYVLITKTYKSTPRLYQMIKHLELGSIKNISYTLFGYSSNFVKIQQKAIQDLQKN